MSHSIKAAVFLTGSIGVACAIVYSVHAQQTEDQLVSQAVLCRIAAMCLCAERLASKLQEVQEEEAWRGCLLVGCEWLE
jgi:hypothetical protein